MDQFLINEHVIDKIYDTKGVIIRIDRNFQQTKLSKTYLNHLKPSIVNLEQIWYTIMNDEKHDITCLPHERLEKYL